MLRTFINGKIHQLKVTGIRSKYSGSCLRGVTSVDLERARLIQSTLAARNE
jgi:aspartate 1-decarboxylase